MAVEEWIDQVCKVWATVPDGKGGAVRSYSVYERDEFPESIATFPCAITYVTSVIDQYSLGGPNIDHWEGITEFHLFPTTDKRNYPAIMLFFARIRNAAAANMKLNNLVNFFMLRQGDEPSIEGPVRLTYASEPEHHGLIVHWIVKDNVTGDFTPAL